MSSVAISGFFAESAELTSEGKLVFRGVKAEFTRSSVAPVETVFPTEKEADTVTDEENAEPEEPVADDLDNLCDIFESISLGSESTKRQREETYVPENSEMKRSRTSD